VPDAVRKLGAQGNHHRRHRLRWRRKDEIMFEPLPSIFQTHGSVYDRHRHGNAYHVGKLDPNRSGFQFHPHEVPSLYGSNVPEMHDASRAG